MTNNTHTPGPWISNIGEDGLRVSGSIYSVPEEGYGEPDVILDFSRLCAEDSDFYTLRGNLALMTAAPDLLAALETIIHEFCHPEPEYYGRSLHEQVTDRDASLNAARTAIAKARGL